MRKRCPSFKRLPAATIILTAIGIWTYRILNRPSFDPASLRDTQGIEAMVVACQRVPRGYQVSYRVTNHRGQMAESVVLEVSVLDQVGQAFAKNPLVNLLHLEAGQQRKLTAFVPAQARAVYAQAKIQVSLVSWRHKL